MLELYSGDLRFDLYEVGRDINFPYPPSESLRLVWREIKWGTFLSVME